MRIDSNKLNILAAKSCLSMIEISKLSGVDTVTISRILKGSQEPRIQTIGKLARALNVQVEDLIKS
ncbi:helix-turn-helix domain-containing protein [Parasporobacterium paucivorans]|uniref:DNA-binding transcriptional regulator, XRE-family HTH domain n=1 Tax=Parasporobacterium paucivorans DSM 15970 TaxID=1122934 RepID=A0A1M6F4H0_9FIRM|nr:helix-turn-helix transcriptional regulator [Parasporobacterium paucivorans]SHI92556.1 DNA-binding transcriptional regulator, XRE-family HTH domain [Parasporobacterium paucivorans DSM 15970]